MSLPATSSPLLAEPKRMMASGAAATSSRSRRPISSSRKRRSDLRKEQYRWYRHGNGYWKSIPKSLRLLQLLRPYDADLLQLAVELVREVLVVRGNPFPIAAPASSRNLRQHPLPCRDHPYRKPVHLLFPLFPHRYQNEIPARKLLAGFS